jgi:hypothetical protein
VSQETRNALNWLSAKRESSAGAIVAQLVHAAADDLLLADAEGDFRRLAEDPHILAAYRSEALEFEGAFEAPIPAW